MCGMHAYSWMLISISMPVLLTETRGFVFNECASDSDIWITHTRSQSIAICLIITMIYFSFVFVLFTIKLKGCLSYSHNHINLYSQLTFLNNTTISLILEISQKSSLNVHGLVHVVTSLIAFISELYSFFSQAKLFSH